MSFSYLNYPPSNFLQNSIFLGGSSVFMHLVLLFGLLILWIRKLVRRGSNDHLKDKSFWYYKPVLFSSLALSLYNAVLFCLNYLHWYRNGLSDEKLVTLFDLAVRALAWLLVSVYLHTQFHHFGGLKFPLLFRIWWGFYLVVSCYCLVVDIAKCWENQCFPLQVLVSDVIYVISGIFFCCAGFFGKVTGYKSNVEVPLLNENDGSAHSSTHVESEKLSPYSNAGFISNLTFSWMKSLIAKGYKKTLNLEDVPPLSGKDSVNESYSVFRSCLESSKDGCGRKITTMQLVKSLIFTTWEDILWTALLAVVCTLASYVGPYLIDTFVQYLNGKREYENEGYVLVSVFFASKLVECLARTHWVFRLQVVGVRMKAVLMESIYKKSLTLSCQA